MRDEHAIGQEVSKLRLRPSVDKGMDNGVQVGAWIDVVRDAGAGSRDRQQGIIPSRPEVEADSPLASHQVHERVGALVVADRFLTDGTRGARVRFNRLVSLV
jgi:hypothetical protein